MSLAAVGHQAKVTAISQQKRSIGGSWALQEMFQQEREKMERVFCFFFLNTDVYWATGEAAVSV